MRADPLAKSLARSPAQPAKRRQVDRERYTGQSVIAWEDVRDLILNRSSALRKLLVENPERLYDFSPL